MHWLQHKIPPPFYLLGFSLLMWWLDQQLQAWRFGGPLLEWLAYPFLIAGVLVDGTALLGFIRAKTTVNPMKPEKASQLVVSGMYRFSRNPMYLGMLLLLTGWALYLGNVAAFALLPVFVGLITVLQIQPEERALQALFGEQYRQYCRQVGRWLLFL